MIPSCRLGHQESLYLHQELLYLHIFKINKEEKMYSLVEFIFHLKFFIIKKIYIYKIIIS